MKRAGYILMGLNAIMTVVAIPWSFYGEFRPYLLIGGIVNGLVAGWLYSQLRTK